jgi:hypothetical protein
MTTETDVIVGIHFLYSETGRRAIQPTPDERIGFVVSVDGDEVTRGAIGDLKGGFDERASPQRSSRSRAPTR